MKYLLVRSVPSLRGSIGLRVRGKYIFAVRILDLDEVTVINSKFLKARVTGWAVSKHITSIHGSADYIPLSVLLSTALNFVPKSSRNASNT